MPSTSSLSSTESLLLQHVRLLDQRLVNIRLDDGIVTTITPYQPPSDQPSSELKFHSSAALEQHTADGNNVHIVDCHGWYVSTGWIDLHVHAYAELSPYGDDMDEIGIQHGVTTIVDAGSCGADEVGILLEKGQSAQTSLLAFLNISKIGLRRTDELSQLEWIDEELAVQAAQRYSEQIIGLKARISSSVVKASGLEPLRRARQLSERLQLPLMVHIGSGPPDIRDVLNLLADGDVITHYLNGKDNNLFDNTGQPLPELLAALARGVHLDVGHGSASFSFEVAEQARAAGIALQTISTDIYRGNRLDGPVYNMSNVLSKFWLLGYELEQIIDAVTKTAAQWLRRPELAVLEVGHPADLTLFSIEQATTILTDSNGQQRESNQLITARGVVKDGTFFAC
ncbi:amidohydrolase/deacetylase family metallohydrolase [Paenibacillus sp. WLX1005]|uniref:amidohydrolase/deacetylase family metallohydrolase n=1 Tax=Paenibacillus sp. WLX1005 TaxID=3243766 RepID=UPI00398445AD